MICKFFKHTGGRGDNSDPRGAVKYVMKTHERAVDPQVVRGSSELTSMLCAEAPGKHKYTSGVLSFTEDEKPNDELLEKIMDSFDSTAFAGLEEDRRNILWVRHEDKGRTELHFVVPRIELQSGKAMNIKPPLDETRWYTWSRLTSINNDLVDPHDPRVSRTYTDLQDKGLRKKDIVDAIEDRLVEKLYDHKILNRDDVLEALKDMDIEVSRINKKSISIVVNDVKIRLKGKIYDEHFNSGEALKDMRASEWEKFESEVKEFRSEGEAKLIRFNEARAKTNIKKYGEYKYIIEDTLEEGIIESKAEKLAREQIEQAKAAQQANKPMPHDWFIESKAEKLAREQAEQARAEKLAREQAEQARAEKLAREQIEQAKAERLDREQARLHELWKKNEAHVNAQVDAYFTEQREESAKERRSFINKMANKVSRPIKEFLNRIKNKLRRKHEKPVHSTNSKSNRRTRRFREHHQSTINKRLRRGAYYKHAIGTGSCHGKRRRALQFSSEENGIRS